MKKRITEGEACSKAAQLAFKGIDKEIERLCKKAGVTKGKVLKRIKDGLDATEIKTKFDGGQFGCQNWVYSKPLVDHATRLKAAEMALVLLNMKPVERKQIEFPDENGKPQPIGGVFSNMELAARLVHLIQKAKDAKRSAKD